MPLEPPDYLSFTSEVFNPHEADTFHDDEEDIVYVHDLNPSKEIRRRFLLQLQKKEYATTALFWATVTANKPLIKFVLENGFDIIVMSPPNNSLGFRHIVHKALKKCNPKMINYMLEQSTALAVHTATGAGTGLTWTTVLHWAIRRHYPMLLKRALEAGANVEQLDHSGYTALHWAAWENDAVATRALLEYGASVRAMDKAKRTPLQDAMQTFNLATKETRKEYYNPPAVIWLLLENEPDRNFKQDDGWGLTLLQLAAMYGHTTLVRDLLDKFTKGGAVPINTQDSLGRTALHLAAKGPHEEVVALLLENKADFLVKDRNGKWAVDLAPKGSETAKLLAALEYPQPPPYIPVVITIAESWPLKIDTDGSFIISDG